jgi:hypothetical protein
MLSILGWMRFSIVLSTLVLAVQPAHAQVREPRVGVASHVRSLDVQEMTNNAGAQFPYQVYDVLIERDGAFAYVHFSELPPLLFDLKRDPN